MTGHAANAGRTLPFASTQFATCAALPQREDNWAKSSPASTQPMMAQTTKVAAMGNTRTMTGIAVDVKRCPRATGRSR